MKENKKERFNLFSTPVNRKFSDESFKKKNE